MIRQFEFDFFLSHTVADQQEIVAPLAEALREAGAKVWYSGRDLQSGEELTGDIDIALGNSKGCIVVCTPNLIAYYRDSWVCKEVNAFYNLKRRPLIPLFWEVAPEDVQEKSVLLASKKGCRFRGDIKSLVDCLLGGKKRVTELSQNAPSFTEKEGLKILILPFLNPGSRESSDSFAEFLRLRMEDFTEDHALNLEVVPPVGFARILSMNQAQQIGEKSGADMVVWGEHYPETQQVRFRYVWTQSQPEFHNMPKRSTLMTYRCLGDITDGNLSGELESILLGLKGIYAYRDGAFEEAISFWTQAQQRVETPDYAFYLGQAYEQLGDLQKAKETYGQVPKENLNHAKACINLGNIALEQRDWNEARRMVNLVLQGDQLLGEAYNNLAILEYSIDRIEQAVTALSKAIKFKAGNPVIIYNYLYLLKKLGRPSPEHLTITSQGKSWVQSTELDHPSAFELKFADPLRLISFRNESPRHLEELRVYLKEKGQPFLLVDQLNISLSLLHFPENDQYVWALQGKSEGESWVNPLPYQNGQININKHHLFPNKSAFVQAEPGVATRSLLFVEKATGKVIFKERVEIFHPHPPTILREISHIAQWLILSSEKEIPFKMQQILWNEYGFIPQEDLKALLPANIQ